jgi:hypothetical protein
VVCVVDFSDFAFFINQQCNIAESVLRDKIAVGLSRISAETYYFDFA